MIFVHRLLDGFNKLSVPNFSLQYFCSLLQPLIMSFLLLESSVALTSRFCVFSHKSIFFKHGFEPPYLVYKNKAQIEGDVEQHTEYHEPPLKILYFLIGLEISEAHDVVHAHKNHDLIEILQFIKPFVLKRVCPPRHYHSHDRLEREAGNLVKQSVPKMHYDHPEHESANDVHEVVVDEACCGLARVFIVNYLAVVH